MRTFERLSSTAPLMVLRGGIDRLRGALMARRPAVRAGLVLAPVLALMATGYWVVAAMAPAGTRYLANDRTFSSDDVITIRKALDAKGIFYRVVENRVEIAAEQYEQAREVFGKLTVGPTTVTDIRGPQDWLSTVMETTQDKERKERAYREKLVEHCINDLNGVVSSLVSIRSRRSNARWLPAAKPSALVWLETEPNRPIPSQTLEAIPPLLISIEPELSRQSITVMDQKGHRYLDPSNPSLVDSSRDQAREEEVRKEVLEKLEYIKGVQVWVQLNARHDGKTAAVPARAEARQPAAAHPGPTIGVNQPIELDEIKTETAPAADPVPPVPVESAECGRVLVNVPRSFYFTNMIPTSDQRLPSNEELREVAARTRDQVLKLVKIVVPDSWTVDVDTLPDDVPPRRAAVLPAGPDSRGKVMDWGLVAAVAAGLALVTALASWIQVVRRPVRLPEPDVRGRRHRVDPGDESTPSKRARELVRRDPEAAASVLQRWATQGGPVS